MYGRRLVGAIAAFSQLWIELTKRTLWSGLDAASLEGHMLAEGRDNSSRVCSPPNVKDAVTVRAQKRTPVFIDK